jgi:hypothetical protein
MSPTRAGHLFIRPSWEEGDLGGHRKDEWSWALVAHACNPSYSGGRDQDSGSKPAWANTAQDPIFKKTHHKKGLVE